MPDFPHDASLDAHLRDVPLPEDFLARLKGAVAPTDEQIDSRLRDVRVPPMVLARLRMTPADAAVDEALSEVALPITLTWRLRSIPAARRLSRYRQATQRFSTAAALFLVIWTTLASSVGALLTAVFPQAESDVPDFAVLYDGPLTIEHLTPLETPPLELALTPIEEAADEESLQSLSVVSNAQPAIYVAAPAPEISRVSSGPVGQWVSLISAGMRPMEDVVLLRYGLLGAPQYTDDVLPELESPRLAAARGIEPPGVRGYNREFFLKHHVFPPISPGASPSLRTLSVPLTMLDESYRRTQSLLRQNRWPAASDIRVEDFIASQDYQFAPPAPGHLGIRTAAGPSVFGASNAGLLQVGVQAGSLARRENPATHVIVALDVSTSMGRGDKLSSVSRGIRRLVTQLSLLDRISLVVFAEEVLQCVDHARRSDGEEITRLLAELQPAGGTNLAVGLQQAASLALSDGEPADATTRLVLITDSRAQMPEETFASVSEMLTSTKKANVQFCVLDVSERAAADAVLTRLTSDLGGDLRRVTHEQQIYSTLLEWTTGQATAVASEVALSIRFNPQTVAAYRLLGHEANSMAGLRTPTTVAEMRAGDAASALIEVWFQNNENDDLGEAELHWLDPVSGMERRVRQRISRLQFAPTFAEMQPALQAAAIAAETGELLRGSRELLREVDVSPARASGFAGLLDVARDVHPQVAAQEDFQQLVALIEALEKTRPR